MTIEDLKELVRPYNSCGEGCATFSNFFRHKPMIALLEEAPASTRWHGNYPGGLLDHTYSVVKSVIDLYPAFKDVLNIFEAIEAALWHDIGKIGLLDYEGMLIIPYYLKSLDKITHKVIYVYNKQLRMSHQELSCIAYVGMSNACIDIEVLKAIRYHNMLYTDDRDTIGEETPLMLIVHHADMIASRFHV